MSVQIVKVVIENSLRHGTFQVRIINYLFAATASYEAAQRAVSYFRFTTIFPESLKTSLETTLHANT